MMRKNITLIFFIFTILSSCGFLYENEVRKIENEKRIYEELRENGDFGIYNWDMTIDSVLILREKYQSLFDLKRKGVDYLVYPIRHWTGRWGTEEFRFKDGKLYQIVLQWNDRSEFGLGIIITSLTTIDPDYKSDSSFVIGKGDNRVNKMFQRVNCPPYRLEMGWYLDKYSIKNIFEKNINKKDSYNYYVVISKSEPEHEIQPKPILKKKIINSPFYWGVKMDSVKIYQKSLGFPKPKYTGYNYLIYPYKKFGNKKGEIEYRFSNNQLNTIVEQWQGFNENDILKMKAIDLMQSFGGGLSEIDLSKVEFDSILKRERETQMKYSWDLDFINYSIILKKSLSNPNPLNIIKNLTHKANQDGKIINYDLYKIYSIME